MGLTEQDYQRLLRNRATAPAKPSKYRNRACYVGTERFDSKREAEHWMALKAREAAGEISDLKRQVPWSLCCPSPSGISEEVCEYRADFQWLDADKHLHVADAKGVRTQLYSLKAKWLKLQYGITIEEL